LPLDGESFEPFSEGGAEVVALEGELYGGFEEAELVAGVVALAFVAEAVDLLVGEERLDGVGELEFAACAGGEVLEHVEDARGEDVAADDGVIGGGVFEAGLFNHVGDVEEAGVVGDGSAVEDAVGGDGGAFDDLGAEDAAVDLVEGFDHLLHAGDGGVDDVVGEEDGEGLVADKLLGHEDGVTEAEGFGLAGVGDAGEVVDGVDDVEEGLFVLGFEIGFELGAGVEVVFHGGLAAAGDDDDLGAAGGDGLFDSVLDEGLVDEAEHLLGHGLGGREKACAQACGGEDGFADFLGGHVFLGCSFCCGNGSRGGLRNTET
jgi:hypothetical protein